ncbi:hypothetical protein GW17_00028747 [Ensete ventricosum]|nr:hypothetical protein GW17_00028747 [Ensete ventricosum]RZS15284.1 hypothetical protein BHM03_00047099 [Ensete ventricosum]
MLSVCTGGWPQLGHLQGGGLLWSRPPTKGRLARSGLALAHGQTTGAAARGWSATSRRLRPARKGRPAVGPTLVGRTRGGVARGGCRPLAGRLSARKGNRRLHRGDGAVRGMEMRRCTHRSYCE